MTPGMIASHYLNDAKQAETQEMVSESLVDMCVSVWRHCLSIPSVMQV